MSDKKILQIRIPFNGKNEKDAKLLMTSHKKHIVDTSATGDYGWIAPFFGFAISIGIPLVNGFLGKLGEDSYKGIKALLKNIGVRAISKNKEGVEFPNIIIFTKYNDVDLIIVFPLLHLIPDQIETGLKTLDQIDLKEELDAILNLFKSNHFGIKYDWDRSLGCWRIVELVDLNSDPYNLPGYYPGDNN